VNFSPLHWISVKITSSLTPMLISVHLCTARQRPLLTEVQTVFVFLISYAVCLITNPFFLLVAIGSSVSNGSGEPAMSPGVESKNGSVRCQTWPKSQPPNSWWAKPAPVLIHQQVSPGLARAVGSNLRFCVSGFKYMIAFKYATVNCKILTLVQQTSFSTYQLP